MKWLAALGVGLRVISAVEALLAGHSTSVDISWKGRSYRVYVERDEP